MARHRKVPEDTKYFKYYNANPKDRHTGDCVIRAIATATKQTWRQVLEDLVQISIETGWSVASTECYEIYLSKLGFVRHGQLRKSDNTKYRGREFLSFMDKKYPETTQIIAHIGSHHMTCFVDLDGDGRRCYDIWNPTGECVGIYWTK